MAIKNRRTRVKICGITSVDDGLAAAAAGADAIGLVFFKDSPRYIDPEKAVAIVDSLPPFVTAVGVFVRETFAGIKETARWTGIQAIQLHGYEKPDKWIGYDRPVIPVIPLEEIHSIPGPGAFPAAGYLIDSGKPGTWGGTGIRLNWDYLAEQLEDCRPDVRNKIVLAGGLDPDNVSEAISKIRPSAVDVSSGVEHSPGIKDHDKIRKFIDEARRAS